MTNGPATGYRDDLAAALTSNSAGSPDAARLAYAVDYLAAEDRKIPARVVQDRGYYLPSDDQLKALAEEGFGASAETLRTATAFAIPVHHVGPDAGVELARFPQLRRRMDIDDFPAWSTSLKFRQAVRSASYAIVHPANAGAVGDPSLPLLLTEGIPKADAALGALGYDDMGVLAYMGVSVPTVARGEAVGPRPGDFLAEHRALIEGRVIYLGFDGDASTKPAVAAAVDRTAAVLSAAGADVFITSIPGGAGIDTYLAGAAA